MNPHRTDDDKMETVIKKGLLVFFTSLGIVVGGSVIGGISAFFVRERPIETIYTLAQELKLWAIVAAMGGTFATFESLDKGLFHGEFRMLIKQLLYILFSLIGAQIGEFLVKSVGDGKV